MVILDNQRSDGLFIVTVPQIYFPEKKFLKVRCLKNSPLEIWKQPLGKVG